MRFRQMMSLVLAASVLASCAGTNVSYLPEAPPETYDAYAKTLGMAFACHRHGLLRQEEAQDMAATGNYVLSAFRHDPNRLNALAHARATDAEQTLSAASASERKAHCAVLKNHHEQNRMSNIAQANQIRTNAMQRAQFDAAMQQAQMNAFNAQLQATNAQSHAMTMGIINQTNQMQMPAVAPMTHGGSRNFVYCRSATSNMIMCH